jgi:tetratricopeptide (TPR) repeat protein
MRAFVFTDKSLERQAGRFVWLAIDTEKADNAAVQEKFPLDAWPTFFVVDPVDESVAVRWVGGASIQQLHRILDDGRLTVSHEKPAASDPARVADAAFARAEQLYGLRQNAEAAKAYEQALAAAPPDWPRYARVVESLLFALDQTDNCDRILELAREAFPRLRRSSSGASVAASALDCALNLPEERAGRGELIDALEKDAIEVAADTSIPMAGDDRSGLYGVLVDARKQAKDEAGARKTAAQWAAFLEGEAARAGTPEGRAVYDAHRLSAYLEMGEPLRALPMLEASERESPGDYNPPARLAVALKALSRWDAALAASDRALAKAYGPRQLTILRNRAEIYEGRGDKPGVQRTLESALRVAETTLTGKRRESAIAQIQKKLDALR